MALLWIETLILIIALAAMIKGSDLFVKSAARIAKAIGVSEFIIGLTLVAWGTSIPELASSIAASFVPNGSGIILGNILGSNIANIGLILGITIGFVTIKIKRYEIEEAYAVIVAALLFAIFAANGEITRIEALIFLLVFIVIVGGTFSTIKPFDKYRLFYYFARVKNLFGFRTKHYRVLPEISKGKKLPIKKPSTFEIVREVVIFIISLILLYIGAVYTVNSAINITEFLKIPLTVISALAIAIGTSLPELFVSIQSIRLGYAQLALGNILGSNIFNILAILGVTGLIREISISDISLKFLTPSMLLFSFILFIYMKKSSRLGRMEGVSLLILYFIFLFLLFTFFAV